MSPGQNGKRRQLHGEVALHWVRCAVASPAVTCRSLLADVRRSDICSWLVPYVNTPAALSRRQVATGGWLIGQRLKMSAELLNWRWQAERNLSCTITIDGVTPDRFAQGEQRAIAAERRADVQQLELAAAEAKLQQAQARPVPPQPQGTLLSAEGINKPTKIVSVPQLMRVPFAQALQDHM